MRVHLLTPVAKLEALRGALVVHPAATLRSYWQQATTDLTVQLIEFVAVTCRRVLWGTGSKGLIIRWSQVRVLVGPPYSSIT